MAQYNRAGASLGEFEEGLYQRVKRHAVDRRSTNIRIACGSCASSHEMGHALGLGLVADPDAVMYKINQDDGLTATAADVAALERVCVSKPVDRLRVEKGVDEKGESYQHTSPSGTAIAYNETVVHSLII